MMRRLRGGEDRPEVTLQNYAAVYRFFGAHRRRDAVAHPLLRFVSLVWAPRLEIDDEVLAQIREFDSAGTGVVVAANHPSGHDALVMASVVWDRRVRFLSAGTGLAKDSLFSGPTRPLFEYTGTIPVFRVKNYPEVPAEVHVAAAQRMIDVCVDRLVAGGVVLSFVEGTNSAPEDLRALRPDSVKKGVGQIVHGARAAGRPMAVLPIGLSYRGRERATLPPRGAVARAGTPLVWDASDPVPTVDDVRAAARLGINAALVRAWED